MVNIFSKTDEQHNLLVHTDPNKRFNPLIQSHVKGGDKIKKLKATKKKVPPIVLKKQKVTKKS